MRLNKAKNSSGKHNRWPFNIAAALFALAFAACTNDSGKTGTTDSNANTVTQPPAIKYDSIPLDAAACNVSWVRDKTVKDVKKKIKLGKATMEVNMDEASFSADGTIPVLSGAWFTEDDKLTGGVVRLNMRELKSLQVDASGQLDMNSPDYLDAEKYPVATIRFLEAHNTLATHGHVDSTGNTATSRSDDATFKALLTIRDKTDTISFHGKMKDVTGTVPQLAEGTFTIDGKAWGLNPKAAKVVKDEMRITLKLVVGKK